MKMIKTFYSNLLLLKGVGTFITLLISFSLAAQSDTAGFIAKHFISYKEHSLQEKIFVHTDRTFYVAGEIIWFKVYCLDADNNKLLGFSKVAYIELLDKDQQPVLQAKIALKDGTGSGSLALPLHIQSGNFLIRSYTSWMKNFDPEFYFHQDLTIINTIQPDTLSAQKPKDNYDVQFFPEGGEMVNELTSKVAFRITDNTGKGVDCNGVIKDNNNDTVLHFQPLRFGIGSFSFTPQKNKQYKAFITTDNGNTITQNLPPALNNGYVMSVSGVSKEERLTINIQTNTDSRFVYLFIHSGKQVKAEQLLPLLNGKAEFIVDKSKLGDGISHITLFDKNNQPVCERLYCKQPQQQLIIDAKFNNTQYLPRKKITIDLLSKDESNHSQPSSLSMAVFLVDSLSVNYTDIYSYLWMTSELKGKVESPEYYLYNKTSEVNEALDNLMLTHGWRKFKWTDVLQGHKPVLKFLPEYEGHIVSGKIVNRLTEAPIGKMAAFLSIPGSRFQLYNSKSNSDGTIHFNTKDFFGTKLMVAMTNTVDTDSCRIDLQNPFSENFSSQKTPSFNFNLWSSQLLKRSVNMQVQNIYSRAQLNLFETARTDTLNFYGKADTKYMLDDYTRFPTMEEVLTEYVREISIRKRRNNFFLSMLNKDENGNVSTREPVILLDGVPQFDFGNKISHYNPLKVQKLETVNEVYFLGTARFDGIASFFTYKGDLDGFQLDSSSTVLDYDALQLRREFYSPAYETNEQYSSRLPDFRSLLYWSPDLITDDNGTKEINFYASDLPGKYAVVVQGISQQGKSGSKIFMIDVKKNLSELK